MVSATELRLPVNQVVCNGRHRQDMGDIEALADSIRDIGLLQSLVLRPDKTLVAGLRRLEAVKLLGWKNVPVRYVLGLEDALPFLKAERDENTCREPFTPSEARAIQQEIMALLKPEAEERVEEGRKKGGKTAGKGRPKADSSVKTFHQAKKSRDKAAVATGYSHKTLEKVGEIEDAAASDPDLKPLAEKLKKRGCKVDRVHKEFKAAKKRKATAEAAAKVSAEELAAVARVERRSMQEFLAGWNGERPDLILTDPPYGKEYLALYGELVEQAAKFVEQGTLLAVMCGQSYLPDVLSAMCEHVPYCWTLAYLTPGGEAAQLWQRKINTFWKPVLVFGKMEKWAGDVFRSDENDKRFHDWGQSESGMLRLIEALSEPGQLVIDPFLGGGTTGVAALASGRRFAGCDSDKKAYKLASDRIAAFHAGLE